TLDNKTYIAIVLYNLGDTIYRLEGYETALPYLIQSLEMRYALGDRSGMVFPFISLARVAKEKGNEALAVQLLAVIEAIGKTVGSRLSPATNAEVEQDVRVLRSQLEAEAFTAAWERGRTLSLED